MSKKIKYEYVDAKGSKHKLNIEFNITPYDAGDTLNLPENGEVEICSITKGNYDFEVPESELIEIQDFIKKNNEEEYKRFEDYDF